MEHRIARSSTRVRVFLDETLAKLPARIRPHHFLWICAFVPIFLLPPFVSLAAAIAEMRRTNVGANSSYEWIALVSALNIILSGLFLYKYHFSPSEIAAIAIGFLRSAVNILLQMLPIPQSPPAKIIPI
ncbi:MAG: hypothetical protein FJX62_14730 [Alphaproteobacteria bacterium]|nr:hypothetical protein [Alphaproteobacteria bacterium]